MISEAPAIRLGTRAWGAARSTILANWPFALVLLAGAALRALAELGFPPAMYINDSFEYVGVALRFQPYPVRPDGYSAFLVLLLPFHSVALVTVVQHVMGLAMAVLLYAVLRRYGVARWLATLGMVPVVLSIYEIQLEHFLLSDVLCIFLCVLAISLLLWRPRPSAVLAGAAGLALAAATLTRSVGTPLLVVAGLYLLVRWPGWRAAAAYVLLGAVPLVAYASWYDAERGNFGLTTANGIYLYSRVMQFADCQKIKPPADLAMLCDSRPVSKRPIPSSYIWHTSPLNNLPGPPGEVQVAEVRFTELRNSKAEAFARDAILAQPGAWLRTSWDGLWKSFAWSRVKFPTAYYVTEDSFNPHPLQIPVTRVYVPGATAATDMQTYQRGDANSHLVSPFAGMLMGYQRGGFLPGPIFGAILIIGALGLVPVRGRPDERRWQLLLLWLVAVTLLVLPDLTAQFDNRYVVPAVPFAGAAAALSLSILWAGWTPGRPAHGRGRGATSTSAAWRTDSEGTLVSTSRDLG